jgi:mono/diheme cytochrome c family protein
MKIQTWFTFVTFAIMTMTPLQASAADAQKGLEHARQRCTTCHVVERGGKGSDQAPAFRTIANDPSRTNATLESWLANPHPPMPNPNLTRIQIDNIVAYIQSLKTP